MGKVSTLDQETSRSGLRAELFVTDVAQSAAFYREVLGFETLRENPSGYRSLGREGAVLGLNDIAQLPKGHPVRPGPGEAVGRGVELVIVVEDIARLYASAVESGLARVSDLVAQPWGLTDFRVVDPDGYYIRITSRSVGG